MVGLLQQLRSPLARQLVTDLISKMKRASFSLSLSFSPFARWQEVRARATISGQAARRIVEATQRLQLWATLVADVCSTVFNWHFLSVASVASVASVVAVVVVVVVVEGGLSLSRPVLSFLSSFFPLSPCLISPSVRALIRAGSHLEVTTLHLLMPTLCLYCLQR